MKTIVTIYNPLIHHKENIHRQCTKENNKRTRGTAVNKQQNMKEWRRKNWGKTQQRVYRNIYNQSAKWQEKKIFPKYNHFKFKWIKYFNKWCKATEQ